MAMSADWLVPDWPAPARVIALSTLRTGGVSAAPYSSFNLGHHVGDAAAAVAANRRELLAAMPGLSALSWLEQVHGTRVVAANGDGESVEADGQYSRTPGIGCTVLTADCLPCLFVDLDASVVAAAHAGWRGLAGGILQCTVDEMKVPADRVMAWLGPAIGPRRFEVGHDVVEAFCGATHFAPVADACRDCFQPAAAPGKFLGDLYALARLALKRAGISHIYGGGLCTVADESRFFSYRRDGVTGRMASVIAITEV